MAKINLSGNTLETRYLPPEGAVPEPVRAGSFAAYLRKLPLKSPGEQAHYFDGKIKDKPNVYDGVIDMEISNRDLQQCADAIMRLRAEYFLSEKKYAEIHFNFTNGFNAGYEKWREGYRVKIKGNVTNWEKAAGPDHSYAAFRKYLELVFTYAGTLSLSREMKTVSLGEMQPGDVFIRGALPGHSIIVVNMACDTVTKQRYFMLASSSTPAQETQVLLNPNANEKTVWYRLDPNATEIVTPEYVFSASELKRFNN